MFSENDLDKDFKLFNIFIHHDGRCNFGIKMPDYG